MSDRIAGSICLLFALYYGFEASRLKVGFGSSSVGPKAFPIMLAIALALFSLALLFRVDAEPAWPRLRQWLNVLSLAASFAVYGLVLVKLGFIIATALETSFVSWRFGGKLWQALLVGVIASVFLYVLFVFGLSISLPKGQLLG